MSDKALENAVMQALADNRRVRTDEIAIQAIDGAVILRGTVGSLVQQAEAARTGSLVVGQIAFTMSRSFVIRAAVALLFAIPAAVAGYHAALGLAHIAIPAEGWRRTLAVAAAIVIAVTAWARMTLSGPRDARQGVAAGQTSPPPATSRTANG